MYVNGLNVSKYDYCYNIFRVYMAFNYSFTYSVLLVAIVIFLITITYVGFSIYFYRNYTEKDPPTMNACPDYWEVDVNGNCIIPKTRNNFGTLTASLVPNMNYKKPAGYIEININNSGVNAKLANNVIYNCTGIPKMENNNVVSNSKLTYTGIASNGSYINNDMNQCYYTGELNKYNENKMVCKYTFKYDIPDVYSRLNTEYTLDVQSTLNPNDRIWSRMGSPVCRQQLWARSNNIEWEGVSNYNKC